MFKGFKTLQQGLSFYKSFNQNFFHNCSIWVAANTQSSSYAWKSILKGREVLREGMRWRVGTGTNIWVWNYPWLPSTFLPFVSSPLIPKLGGAQVSSLINPITNQWDFDLLQACFLPRDISSIKSIHLSSNLVEDTLKWPFTPSGVYTVKSGYRFLYNNQRMDEVDYQLEETTLWKKKFGHGSSTKNLKSPMESSEKFNPNKMQPEATDDNY